MDEASSPPFPRPPLRRRVKEGFLYGSFVAFLWWTIGIGGCVVTCSVVTEALHGPSEFVEGYGIVSEGERGYFVVQCGGGAAASAVGWTRHGVSGFPVDRLAWTDSVIAISSNGRYWSWVSVETGQVTGPHDDLPPGLDPEDVLQARTVFRRHHSSGP